MSDGRTPTGAGDPQQGPSDREELRPESGQPPQQGQQPGQAPQQGWQPGQAPPSGRPGQGQQPTWSAPQQDGGSPYRASQPNPQQPNPQQPNPQQPNLQPQYPNPAQPPNPTASGTQPWWNQQQAGTQGGPGHASDAPTQRYPAAGAPTQRFGAPGAPGAVAGQQGHPPQPRPNTQGYPVQYAAGPGQQHSAAPGFGPYGQQGGHPAAGGSPSDTRPKRRFSWGAASLGLLAGAAVGALITLAVTGQFVRPVFTGASVEDGVQGVLEDEFGLPDVRDVSCPEEPSAAAGAEFACAFTTGDREFSVQVRVLDSGGQYLVGAVTSGD